MKNILLCILFSMFALGEGCSKNGVMSAGSGSSIDPPFPKTKSIMPLAVSNQWTFSYTPYDSNGKMLSVNRLVSQLNSTDCYELKNDTHLIRLTIGFNYDSSSVYAYGYQWGNQKNGYLVVSRDLYLFSKRGLYIVGEYHDSTPTLYQKEKLWLAYPVDSGRTWPLNLDSGNDTTQTALMEVISTHARFNFPNSQSGAAQSFCNCIVYKKTKGDSISYNYYNDAIGLIGFELYVKGTLAVTDLLISFAIAN